MRLSENLELLKEWDYKKNEGLNPSDFSNASHKKVYWLCDKGHSYLASISSRTANNGRATGCPYCNRKKVLAGFNDLEHLYPYLSKYWDYDKNSPVTPKDIFPYSLTKYWWICPKCGISYQMSPATRKNNKKYVFCKECSAKQATKNRIKKIVDSGNSLFLKNKKLSEEWHPTKNGDLKPRDVTSGSNKKVWWLCSKCGNEWKDTISHRTSGRGCPKCGRKSASIKLSKKNLIVGETDLLTTFPEIAKEWDYEKNNDSPRDYTAYSGKKKWWICDKGHSYDMVINNRTSLKQNCPICSGTRVLAGFNDLAFLRPKLIKEWDFLKNKKGPDQYTVSSCQIVYWLCDKGHSYKKEISDRSRVDGKATGCPYCANKKVLQGYNDLQTIRPDVLVEWDYDKNTKSPSEYLPHSNKSVYWKCDKGHSYYMPIDRKTSSKPYKCPICNNKQLLIGYNDLKTLFPEVASEWNYEMNNLKPEDFIAGSHKKVYWRCNRCNNVWKAQIKERTYGGTGCPKCAHYYGTSIPEQAIYYYVKEVYSDSINSYKPDFLNGMEIDIFIPKIKVGIEYDGRFWHDNNERDERKSTLLKDNGIRLIRIKELNTNNPYNDYAVIKSEYRDDIRELSSAVNELMNIIEPSVKHDVNILNDSNKIYCMSTEKKLQKSLLATEKDMLKEWNYELNGSLTPDLVTPGSRKIVWWHCSKCGNDWQQSIKTKYKGGLLCPSCSKTRSNDIKILKKIKAGQVKSILDYPNLLAEWDDQRDPSTVSKGSDYKANWKCSVCGNHFKQVVKSRTLQGQGCPKCGVMKSANTRRKK